MAEGPALNTLASIAAPSPSARANVPSAMPMTAWGVRDVRKLADAQYHATRASIRRATAGGAENQKRDDELPTHWNPR